MVLILYLHPLASFCHKVLIALYENGTPFEARTVDLMDEKEAAHLADLWPVGKIPVLRDEARKTTVAETTIILEYLEQHYPGARPLLPASEPARLDARLWDRFFDLYVHALMQKIVTDRLRPEGANDPHGVAEAHATLDTAYGMIERQLRDRAWAIGSDFSIADCAAAPALFYAGIVHPFADGQPNLAAYFERLMARPSVVRVIEEARPFFKFFPYRERMPERFLAGSPSASDG